MSPSESHQLDAIFFPALAEGMVKLASQNLRFAYYTTAETATRILQSREVWLRNTGVMNDYMEVQHGMECLKAAWEESAGATRMKTILEELSPGSVEKLQSLYNGWHPIIQSGTFITCMSEHPVDENDHGRLSMWRAYGGKAGIAFVFKPDFLALETADLGAYSHPVSYLDVTRFAGTLATVAQRMEAQKAFLKSCAPEQIHNSAFMLLLWSALATKHPGFAEEKEWRVAAVPSMWKSKILRRSIEVIGGVAQPVLKLPLQNFPEHQITGLAISEMLERVIIGPCDNPRILCQAFAEMLDTAGVKEPLKKITISGIPLRHSV